MSYCSSDTLEAQPNVCLLGNRFPLQYILLPSNTVGTLHTFHLEQTWWDLLPSQQGDVWSVCLGIMPWTWTRLFGSGIITLPSIGMKASAVILVWYISIPLCLFLQLNPKLPSASFLWQKLSQASPHISPFGRVAREREGGTSSSLSRYKQRHSDKEGPLGNSGILLLCWIPTCPACFVALLYVQNWKGGEEQDPQTHPHTTSAHLQEMSS